MAAVVTVIDGPAFSATYEIAEPELGGFNEWIRAQAPSGEPEFGLELRRAAGNAQGRLRLRIGSGSLLDVQLVGRWNDATRTFEGQWHVLKQKPGTLTIQLKQP